MRRTHQRVAWALAAASGLGIGVATAAVPAQPAVVQPADPEASAGQDRLAEIKVELAWLADPATFPSQLAARVRNGTLEVGGMVRGEQLHRRVLLLASTHGRLPLRDKLTVLPAAAPRPLAPDSNAQLCRNASQVMSRLTAGKTGDFQIAADADGQISISGPINSYEDKLKVSRHLSQIPGCTAVINNLAVATVSRQGMTHTVISADGRLTVPSESDQSPARPAPAATTAVTYAPVQPAKESPYTAQLQTSAPPASRYGGSTAMSAAEPRYSPPVGEQPVVYQQAAATYTPPVKRPTVIARDSTYGGSYNSVPPPKKPAQTAPAGSVQQVAAKVSTENLKPAAVKPVQVSADQLAGMIRARIEIAFAGSVHDVNVSVLGDKHLQIKVFAVRTSDAPTLGKKIMSLPELAPYKVDLQIPVE